MQFWKHLRSAWECHNDSVPTLSLSMRDLDLTSLRLFVSVCDSGNIARAAEQHHIVASAVSKRLAQMEADTGVPLLVRQRRGVVPTAAGEALLEHARTMLACAQRIRQDMSVHGAGLHGQVRVLAAMSAIAEFLPDEIAAFLRDPAHRQIQVDIDEDTSKMVVQGVSEGRAALGICWDAADFKGLESLPFRQDHLAVVVPAGHPLAGRKRIAYAHTLDHEQVGLPPASAVQRQFERAAALAGKTLRYRTTVSGFDAALRVVAAGLAISVVPREIAVQHAAAARLRVIPLTDAWAERTFALCFRDRDALSPAAQALVTHLTQAHRAKR